MGVLVSVVLSRRKLQREDGVFAFNVRPEGASKWPRQVVYGRQVRDVLVTNRSAALVRAEFHAVDNVADLALDDPPRKPADAFGRLVTLAGGSRLEVAVSACDVGHADALASASPQQAAPVGLERPDRPWWARSGNDHRRLK